jgi:hypothetical protein
MKENLKDKKQVFLLYTLFCGDATKTSHALGCSVLAVAKLAEEGNWDEKVGEIASLRKSDRPGDLERAINRAINYTDAHRYRLQLQRVLECIQSMPDEELDALLIMSTVDKAGNVHRHLSTRALADLSSALEKAHALTYLALGDTAQDRARRKEESDDGVMAASVMNQQIIEAMAEKGGGQLESPKDQLEEDQARRAQEIALGKPLAEVFKEEEEATEPQPQTGFEVPPITKRKRHVRMRKGRTKRKPKP